MAGIKLFNPTPVRGCLRKVSHALLINSSRLIKARLSKLKRLQNLVKRTGDIISNPNAIHTHHFFLIKGKIAIKDSPTIDKTRGRKILPDKFLKSIDAK